MSGSIKKIIKKIPFVGSYVIYEEVKRRPRYIISKVIKNGNIQD